MAILALRNRVLSVSRTDALSESSFQRRVDELIVLSPAFSDVRRVRGKGLERAVHCNGRRCRPSSERFDGASRSAFSHREYTRIQCECHAGIKAMGDRRLSTPAGVAG